MVREEHPSSGCHPDRLQQLPHQVPVGAGCPVGFPSGDNRPHAFCRGSLFSRTAVHVASVCGVHARAFERLRKKRNSGGNPPLHRIPYRLCSKRKLPESPPRTLRLSFRPDVDLVAAAQAVFLDGAACCLIAAVAAQAECLFACSWDNLAPIDCN